jgi:hypothetical protein
MKNEQHFPAVAGIWSIPLLCSVSFVWFDEREDDTNLGSSLAIIHRERGWEDCPLRSVLVLSPGEILPLRLTFHPTRYIVREKALLSSFRSVAMI